jgi:hypothetical protein
MEIWKDIKGYEGLYKVSNTGKVKSLDRIVIYINGKTTLHKGKLLNQSNSAGYPSVRISKNGKPITVRIHRLVAEAFISNPSRLPHVLHRNDIKDDNRVENLMWGTIKDNMDDRNNKGRQARGISCGLSVLKNEDILLIKKELANYKSGDYGRIADSYGVSYQSISNIHKGKTWKHI